MAEIVIIYSTFPDKASAVAVAKTILQEKQAACINIFPAVFSLYEWEGKLEEAEEVVMIAKTAKSLAGELTERIISLHSYSCPCVVVLPVEGGNDGFLQWVSGKALGIRH